MISGVRPVVRRVALIESDEFLGCTIEFLLGDEGWIVQRYASLEAARDAFELMPELLVLGLRFGDRSGSEVLAPLVGRTDAPPTVILSASPELARIAERYGVVPVRKPFDIEQLLAAIHRALTEDRRPRLRAVNG
jgi:DNA-binding response OmpR family regulator